MKNCDFEPKPEQIKFAEIYLDLSIKLTFLEIAKGIGLHNNTITNWFKNSDFVDWLNLKKNGLLNKSLMAHYKTAIRRAEAGDFSFSKLLFEMEGEYTPSRKIEAEFIDKTEQELEKRFDERLERDPDFKKRVIGLYEETEQILKEASE